MQPETSADDMASFSLPRLLLSTAILAAVVVAGWMYLSPGSAESTAASSNAAAPVPAATDAPNPPATNLGAPAALPVPVATATAARRDLVMHITATGNAEAEHLLGVTAATSGLIQQLAVQEGDRVAEGDLLVALDDSSLLLARQRARERLVQAMARYQEKRIFLEVGGGSGVADELIAAQEGLLGGVLSAEQFRSVIDDPKFDALFATITRDEIMAAQDGLMTARADFAGAELELERTRVLAPFDGQVAGVDAVVGQRVSAGAPLLTLVDADPIRLRVGVLESEAGLVRQGRQAEVTFAAYPGETFRGTIDTISPLVDPDSKTLEVIVSLPNPELRLKPGMFAQVVLDTEIFGQRLLVPSSAVLLRDDRPMLFVVENERARWVYIQKGLENTEWVEVLDGVSEGDEVITSGHYSLAHDAAVRIADPTGEPDAPERD